MMPKRGIKSAAIAAANVASANTQTSAIVGGNVDNSNRKYMLIYSNEYADGNDDESECTERHGSYVHMRLSVDNDKISQWFT